MSTRVPLPLLLAVLLIGACQNPAGEPGPSSAPSALEHIRNVNVIRVGVSEFAPWVLKDKHDRWMGFEIDVAARLADDLGVKLEIEAMPWEMLISELEKGEIDLIASGMSITPARALHVNFSNPYHHSETTLLANRDRVPEFKTRQEFDKPDTRVAVVKGTTSEATARWALPRARILLFETQEQVVGAVKDGQVHVAVVASPTPRLALIRYPGQLYVPLEEPIARTSEAFAVRKGETEFITFLNAWIAGHTADRFLERRQAYWFASLGWEDRL